jgi:hypothetical protein
MSNPYTDPGRAYGIAHFTQKYGIKPNESAHVKVAVGEIQDHIVCWRDTEYGKLPFFEKLHGRNLLEVNGNTVQVNFDVFHAVGHCLSGHLENLMPEEKKKIASIPFVDIYEKILFDAIKEAADLNGKGIKPKPFWPEGKKFAVCLTHDIDEIRKTYQYFTRPVMHLKRGELDRSIHHVRSFFEDQIRGHNPYWTFENMLALEEELGVRSSSYFLQESGKIKLRKPSTLMLYARKYKFSDPRVSGMMKRMDEGGWEVGLHGSYYSYLSEDKLRSEKKGLEASLGKKVVGTRQHHLNLRFPDTWTYQEDINLRYDTSLGLKNDIGFRWGTCFPFHPLNPKTGKAMNLLELPLIIMDTPLLTQKRDIWESIYYLIESVEKQEGLLTILFHHTVFNEKEYPNWYENYEKIITTCRNKGAWITNGTEIDSWWRLRQKNGD